MTREWHVSLSINSGTESALMGLQTQQQYRDTLTKAVLRDLICKILPEFKGSAETMVGNIITDNYYSLLATIS